jgi:hypothetical protein
MPHNFPQGGYRVPTGGRFLNPASYDTDSKRAGVVDVSDPNHALHPYRFVGRSSDPNRVDWNRYVKLLNEKVVAGDRTVLDAIGALHGKAVTSKWTGHAAALKQVIDGVAQMQKAYETQQAFRPVLTSRNKALYFDLGPPPKFNAKTPQEWGKQMRAWREKVYKLVLNAKINTHDKAVIDALREVGKGNVRSPYHPSAPESQVLRQRARQIADEPVWANRAPTADEEKRREKNTEKEQAAWRLRESEAAAREKRKARPLPLSHYKITFGEYKGMMYQEAPAPYWMWIKKSFYREWQKFIYQGGYESVQQASEERAAQKYGNDLSQRRLSFLVRRFSELKARHARFVQRQFEQTFLRNRPEISWVGGDQVRYLFKYLTDPTSRRMLQDEIEKEEREKIYEATRGRRDREAAFKLAYDIGKATIGRNIFRGEGAGIGRDVTDPERASGPHKDTEEARVQAEGKEAARFGRAAEAQIRLEKQEKGAAKYSKETLLWHKRMVDLWERIDSAKNEEQLEGLEKEYRDLTKPVEGRDDFKPYVQTLKERLQEVTNTFKIRGGVEEVELGAGGLPGHAEEAEDPDEAVRRSRYASRLPRKIAETKMEFLEREARVQEGRSTLGGAGFSGTPQREASELARLQESVRRQPELQFTEEALGKTPAGMAADLSDEELFRREAADFEKKFRDATSPPRK